MSNRNSWIAYVLFLIMACLLGCKTTAALDIEVKKTRPAKFYYDYSISEIENLGKALYYIWLLENYTLLLEEAIW
ncbi:hypothetical protein [Borrelia sp. P9F1]|uniref:hypothetical protein n=1 Tax=Borrelia sp. P9F1 TaxID=3058374 RepID=UPI002649F4AA|nr:hypothetical protein [Borrelia sp. P9F1]WKC58575.1 hypothetical protein QYZ68_05080 [Borrelia sp. P9F1]